MNNLTMGLLLAREKLESDTLTMLCGVRCCPEVLGTFHVLKSGEKGAFTLTRGYAWAPSQNCFLKSRRAAHRDLDHRNCLSTKGSETACQQLKQRVKAKANPGETLRLLRESGLEDRRIANKERDYTVGTWPAVHIEPFAIKCGRCGRMSKIIPIARG